MIRVFFRSSHFISTLLRDAQREIENNQKKSEVNIKEVQVHLFVRFDVSSPEKKKKKKRICICTLGAQQSKAKNKMKLKKNINYNTSTQNERKKKKRYSVDDD